MEKQRKTFLSYSRANKNFAVRLAAELKSEGLSVWLDQLDIPAGARWDREVEKALKECEIFMIILTPASIDSENVLDEIGYAIDTGKRFLPVLLEKCDVPLRLRRFQYVDFTDKSFDDGVKSAKELLRSLIDQPTIPPIQPSEGNLNQLAQAKAERKAREEADELLQAQAARKAAEKAAKEKEEKEAAEREAMELAARRKAEREAKDKVAVQKRRTIGPVWLTLGVIGFALAGFVIAIRLLPSVFGGVATAPPTKLPLATNVATIKPELTPTPILPTIPQPIVNYTDMRLLFQNADADYRNTLMVIVNKDGISETSDSSLPYGSEISRDGLWVAYDTCIGQNRAINISQLDGTKVTEVASISGEYCTSSIRWSPDNQKLSYESPSDNMLHIVEIRSRIDTPISGTFSTGWHAWSPTGDRIIYGSGYGGSRQLIVTDMNGNTEQLTSDECDNWSPDWSPDGNIIVFTCGSQLYTINPDGSNLRQIGFEEAYSPRWSLDGQWIYYLSNITLKRIQWDGQSLQTVGQLPFTFPNPFSLGPLK